MQVHRATAPFEVAGKRYPSGSYVVKTGQAFRAHVVDMFEPQDHPNDFAYPGAPPTRPYDAAGYTLAFQMGVQFDRVLDGFSGPFEEIKELVVAPPPAHVVDTAGAAGFFLSARANDSFRAVNRLQQAGVEVLRLRERFTAGGATHEPGEFFVANNPETLPLLEKIATEIGTPFKGVVQAPVPQAQPLPRVRIGLWDRYGGSMPSGWTRWILERFEFRFNLVFAPELDKGDLRKKYDVLVFVDGAISGRGARGGRGGNRGAGAAPAGGDQDPGEVTELEASIPPEYRGRRGSITTATTIPQLRKFLEQGGTVLTIGSSTSLARELGLPVSNHLSQVNEDGEDEPLGPTKFYVPPSVLRVRVNAANPLAWGIGDAVDVLFTNSPTFRLPKEFGPKGLTKVAWFDSKTPLRSGWAWGQQYLENGVAIAEAKVGQGRLVLFGPEILFRGQPHGTFKFFFNGLVEAGHNESAARTTAVPSHEGIGGALLLPGHGPVPAAAIERFADEAGGKKAKIVLLAATGDDSSGSRTLHEIEEVLKKKEAAFSVIPYVAFGKQPSDDASIKAIDEASGIWLERAPGEAGFSSALRAALNRSLAKRRVIAGPGAFSLVDSSSLVAGAAILPLGSKDDGLEILQKRLAQTPGRFGIAIEEQAVLLLRNRRLNNLGGGAVHILQAPGAGRPASDKLLKAPRDTADLVSQRRIAFQRTQAPFPPAKLEAPHLAAGSLLIGGGGGLSPAIWKKFIELAGGPDAPIVVIPTAGEDPQPGREPGEARALKANGATKVTILHTRNRDVADTEAFVKPLLEAKGVWFTGGRQWRFVDAYEGTRTEQAVHDVLARGGVIGGSSAGASIQTEYMPRGDPLGNLNIIAEGYERGFGFLKGVAVDQHFFARKRLADMTQLVNAYPQLLGIGIDEGTVIIVQGNRFEVVGKSKVAVYDRRKAPASGNKDYEELPVGAVYDLEARKRIDSH